MNHCCMKWIRNIVSTGNGGRPRLPSGACGNISATSLPHGTTRFISSRNSRLRVRLVVKSNPRLACLMPKSSQSSAHLATQFLHDLCRPSFNHLIHGGAPRGEVVHACVLPSANRTDFPSGALTLLCKHPTIHQIRVRGSLRIRTIAMGVTTNRIDSHRLTCPRKYHSETITPAKKDRGFATVRDRSPLNMRRVSEYSHDK